MRNNFGKFYDILGVMIVTEASGQSSLTLQLFRLQLDSPTISGHPLIFTTAARFKLQPLPPVYLPILFTLNLEASV